MPETNDGNRTVGADPLLKLLIDRDEVRFALRLWSMSGQPGAADRVREFTSPLEDLDRQILELEVLEKRL